MPDLLLRLQRSLLRRTDEFLRTSPLLRPWRIDRAVDVEDLTDGSITNLQVIEPAQDRVSLGATVHDAAFLHVARHYREGWYARPSLLTCEVPGAWCHVATGLVCTRDFLALNDSQLKYRMDAGPAAVGNRVYRPFRWFRPRRARRVPGLCATIGNIYGSYWGHWLFDCLPRLCLLEKAAAGAPVTLLVPDDLPPSWNESLAAVLPPNFELFRLPPNSWVRADRLLLASCPAGRANNHMPPAFYEFVRRACFTKFGLPPGSQPSGRLYISRAGTRHRRILNEKPLIDLLARYGFKTVALEKLSFRQQVELFHRAEIVVAADGSNWADMLFAGRIKVCVLYSQQEPNTHWFTAAKGLGQDHFFLAANAESPHADFTVDLPAPRARPP